MTACGSSRGHGDFDSFEAFLAAGDPTVAADKVHEVGALHQKLRHDRVVVVLLRQVAIGASFSFGRAAAGGHGQTVEFRMLGDHLRGA